MSAASSNASPENLGIENTLPPKPAGEGPVARYDAFISYSHRADRDLARSLERTLWKFGRPWYSVRGTRTFRDETDLSADPDLWGNIELAVKHSRCLLLLASPSSARSKWVPREVAAAISAHGRNSVCILLTDGVLPWTDGISPAALFERPDGAISKDVWALLGIAGNEPFVIDLRPFRDCSNLTRRRDDEFLSRVASVAAKALGRDKQEIWGQYYRALRFRGYFLAAMALVLLALSVGLGFALRSTRLATEREVIQRRRAEAAQQSESVQRREAESQRDAAKAAQLAATAAKDAEAIQRVEAERERDAARSESFSGAARSLVETNPETAALYAVHAIQLAKRSRTQPGVAEQTLRLSLSHLTGPAFRGFGRFNDGMEQLVPRGVETSSMSHDERFLAAGTGAGQVYVWRLDSRQSVEPLNVIQSSPREFKKFFSIAFNSILSVRFAFGDRWLVVRANREGIRAFDTRRGFAEVPLPEEWQRGDLLSISPNGTDIAIVSRNRLSLSLWRLAADDTLARIQVTPQPLDGQITSASYSADGKRILVRYSMSRLILLSADGVQRTPINLPAPDSYLDAETIKYYEKDEPDREVTEISPDGKILLASKRVFSDRVQPQRLGAIWDISSGRPALLRRFPTHKDAMTGAVISPDGRWVAIGHDRQVSIWDLTHTALTDAPSAIMSVGDSEYSAMAFDYQSVHLAVSGSNGTVFLQDLTRGIDTQPTPHRSMGERPPVFSKSGRWLLTADGESQTVRLCDVSRNCEGVEGRETDMTTAEGCASEGGAWIAGLRSVNELSIVFDGNRMNSRTAIRLPWTVKIDQRYRSQLSVQCSANRKWMLVRAVPVGSTYLINISRAEPKVVEIAGAPANLDSAQFDPSGTLLILTSTDTGVAVRLTDSARLVAQPLPRFSGGAISFSKGGGWIVEQSRAYVRRGERASDPLLRRIDASSIGEPMTITGLGKALKSVRFSDHDTTMLGSEEIQNEYSPDAFEATNPPVRAYLWFLNKTLATEPQVVSGHRGSVNAVFSPDGSWLATTDGIFQQRMKNVQLRRTSNITRSVLSFQMEAPAQVLYPMFDPGGKWFILGKGQTAAFYSLDRLRGAPPYAPDFEIESGARVTAHWNLKWSPDERWIVNEGNSTPVRVWWRSADNKVILQAEAADQHEALLAFTHDSKYLITSSRASTLIWTLDSATGTIWQSTMPGGGSILLPLDERRVTTITPDGPKTWILDRDELVALARNVVARNLTLNEWTRVLSDTPYEKTFPELPVDISLIEYYVEQSNTAANADDDTNAHRWISLAATAAIESKNPHAALRVADAGVSIGDAHGVLDVAEFAAKAMPGDPGAWEMLGLARLGVGNTKGAVNVQRFVNWALDHGARPDDLQRDLGLIDKAKHAKRSAPN